MFNLRFIYLPLDGFGACVVCKKKPQEGFFGGTGSNLALSLSLAHAHRICT